MMKQIKTLNTADSQSLMEEWINHEGTTLPSLDSFYLQIRIDLQELFNKAMESQDEAKSRNDYYIDVIFGVKLYEYLKDKPWFNIRIASDIGFWRYLSIMVIPDVVAKRWGYENEDHYWKRPSRIWLRSVWLYVHIANENTISETRTMLLNERFSTDTILNLIERSGRDGININVYRNIIKVYSIINKETLYIYKKKSKKGDDLFRAVMRLNTARGVVVEPEFCIRGTLGYVCSLFESFGVNSAQMVEFKQ